MDSQFLSICAVVVTYNPELEKLRLLVDSLEGQASEIVIIDNGSCVPLDTFLVSHAAKKNLNVLNLDDNFGIAYAQNIGIEYARSLGARYVCLFDQDSCPEKDMIHALHCSAVELDLLGVRVAAVAPSYKDAQRGSLSSFVRVGCFSFNRTFCKEGAGFVEADFLISSGSLIPMAVIDDVGNMDAGLFIDHVDTEWCFRAKSKGYKLFGVCNAVMLHSIGERRVTFWFLRWRTVSYHLPFRYYYMFRNSILLQRRNYMPFSWKVADITRCVGAIFFFAIFSTSRIACVKMMLRGFWDGLWGVTGKIKR